MKFLASLLAVIVATPVFADCGVRAVYQNRIVNNHAVVVKVERRVFFSVGEDTLSNDDVQRVSDAVVKRLEVISGDPAPPIGSSDLDFNLVGTVTRGGRENSNDRVFSILNTSCIQCHKPGAKAPGNIQFFTADRKLFVNPDKNTEKVRRGRIADAVDISNGGTMPKGTTNKLSAAQIALIRRWSEE